MNIIPVRIRLETNARALADVVALFEQFQQVQAGMTEAQQRRELARFHNAIQVLECDARMLREELAEVEAAAGYWSMHGTPNTTN